MGEYLIYADIAFSPAEVGCGTRFLPGSRTSCYGIDTDVIDQQSRLSQWQQPQLDAGGEAAGVGQMLASFDEFPVQFRQTVDEVVLGSGNAEILSEVNDFYPFRDSVLLQEFGTLSVPETKEQDVNVIERQVGAEFQFSIAKQPSVDITDGIARIR